MNRLSYSQLSTFKSCPEQYKIIYIDGVRKKDESIEAFMGKRVHEVLEWLYDKKDLNDHFITFDTLANKYKELWEFHWHNKIHIYYEKNNEMYYFKIGQLCLSNYYLKYGFKKFNQPIKNTEVVLEFQIGNYPFRGVIDRLDYVEPDKWIINDYKTSKRAKNYKQAMSDVQLALYYIAVQQNYSQINQIYLTWHFLRLGTDITISYEEDKNQLKKMEKKIIKMTDNLINSLDDINCFFPKESMLCNWCYLWEECSVKLGTNPAKIANRISLI